jgi:rhodanese-related sulfurtransferase
MSSTLPDAITPAELRAEALDGDEVAVLDVREGDAYATGHVSVAVLLPLGEIELRIARLLPRTDIRIVVTDDDGGDDATRAAGRLHALGYRNARILAGGVRRWAAEGGELITGLNSLSKALGEFVERNDHTPKITATELHRALQANERIVVLDTRPLEEFAYISIPGGIAAPGAELLHRVYDAVPSPDTKVVVNCAGRTRAIIGAQALRNAGFPNPVVSLENGTAAWLLSGFSPARGATQQAAPPTADGLAKAKAGTEAIARRFGILHIDRQTLDGFEAGADRRTLYVFDVRAAEEYVAGHLPGALSAPGGQLVQATDLHVGARAARIVLADDPDLVRATITASWLVQSGLEHVYVYAVPEDERTATGPEPRRVLGDSNVGASVQPNDLAGILAAGGVLLDLEPAPPYYRPRRYIQGSTVARRATLARTLRSVPGRGTVVLTSWDGALARLAAAELAGKTDRQILVLAGGTAAWIEAGLGTPVVGLDQPALDPRETLPQLPTLEERRVTLAAYVRWGDTITDQLARDGLVRFRRFAQ